MNIDRNRKNVLIYPGNGCNALEVYRCLEYSLRYKPILGNAGYTHGEYITDDCYTDLPFVDDTNFVDKINSFISDHDIEFIIPTHDTVCEEVMKVERQIAATIVCSPFETAHICRHKLLTYGVLSDYDFIPEVYDVNDIYEDVFPVFAKDDVGQGGKKAFVAYDYENLMRKFNDNAGVNYVLTEYLPGDEITIDCFTDRNGKLLFSSPRERVTILDGMSGTAKIIPMTDEIQHICESVNEKIEFRGYWYIQCKKDNNGVYKLMEISTRFSGTFGLTATLDVNFPILALTDFEDIDVKIVPNKCEVVGDRGYEMRYKININYNTVYFDFDDTLVFDRKTYNPLALAFLFQCKNEGKRVILLTRHAYDIHETIRGIHLDEGLFERIIEVSIEKSKADYIEAKKSILIDNSFKDRTEVKELCGIATFDVCNIKALLNN